VAAKCKRLWSSNVTTCEIPRTCTSLDEQSFTGAGLQLWNNLPLCLHDSELTLLEFQWLLKTHLFSWGLPHLEIVVVFKVRHKCTSALTYLFTYLITMLPIQGVHASWKVSCVNIKDKRTLPSGKTFFVSRNTFCCYPQGIVVYYTSSDGHTKRRLVGQGTADEETAGVAVWPMCRCDPYVMQFRTIAFAVLVGGMINTNINWCERWWSCFQRCPSQGS